MKQDNMNPTDAFGNEIKVGSKIIHSRQGNSHRHRLLAGVVTEVRVITVHYVTINGVRRHAKRFNMVAVVG